MIILVCGYHLVFPSLRHARVVTPPHPLLRLIPLVLRTQRAHRSRLEAQSAAAQLVVSRPFAYIWVTHSKRPDSC